MSTTHDIVGKLWNLFLVVRDDGVTCHQYLAELTFLLFLKMADETDAEQQLPAGYCWRDIVNKDSVEQLEFYKILLFHLGTHGSERVQAIFSNANTGLRQPRILKKLVHSIDELDWYNPQQEGLGDLYKGLLEKNATEVKSGAGQSRLVLPLLSNPLRLVDYRDERHGNRNDMNSPITGRRFSNNWPDTWTATPKSYRNDQRRRRSVG